MLRYFEATASPQRNDILRQVLAGKRRWAAAEFRGDAELFRSNVVGPLRELKYEGIIPALSETELPVGDDSQIAAVEIIGRVTYRAANGNEDEPASRLAAEALVPAGPNL